MRFGFLSEKGSFNMLNHLYTSFSCPNFQSFQISPDQFFDFMKKREFEGLTLSRSFQKDAYYLCDEVDDQARLCKLVNCIRNDNGRLIGTNTDFDGFLYTFKKKNVDLQNKVVLIIGNGQIAKIAKAACTYCGAQTVKMIYFKSVPGSITYKEAYDNYSHADIIINTFSGGRKNNDFKSPLDLSSFPNVSFVMDTIYNPLLTRLLLDAKELGILYANGLKAFMYTHYSCSKHFGLTPNVDLDSIETNLIRYLCNYVFIGMPGSGKTTIGRILNKKSHKKWVDLDILITRNEKKSVSKIFDEAGEEGFRQIETQCVKDTSAQTNLIISCGGGVITREINMTYLSQNGLIIHLDRPIEFLKKKDSKRPLLRSNTVEDLYNTRYPIYRRYADISIPTENSLDETLVKVLSFIEDTNSYNKFK